MIGTFNLKLDRPFASDDLQPAMDGICADPPYDYRKFYWLVKLQQDLQQVYAWAFRWEGGRMPLNVLELLSRRPIPETFKQGPIDVSILERWDTPEVQRWAQDQYWFQDFSWAPVHRANTGLVWGFIRPVCRWSGRRVLDIGSHYGAYSFLVARDGAAVSGFDIDADCVSKAILINEHIEMMDVSFGFADPGGTYDVILYLSVHHQKDPTYDDLARTVGELRARTKHLFVELILPSSQRKFGNGRSDSQVDQLVNGKVLHTYKHGVRGVRRIYHLEGS